MNKLLNICLFLLPGIFLAQQTAIYTDELADFQHAVSLYNNKSYQAAQTIFTQIKTPLRVRLLNRIVLITLPIPLSDSISHRQKP